MKNSKFLNSSVSHQNTAHRKIPTADGVRKTGPVITVLGKDADTRLLYKSFLEMWNYRIVEAGGVEELLTITEYL